jgi:hypothetical protein
MVLTTVLVLLSGLHHLCLYCPGPRTEVRLCCFLAAQVTISTLLCGFYPLMHSVLYIILQVGCSLQGRALSCFLVVATIPGLAWTVCILGTRGRPAC